MKRIVVLSVALGLALGGVASAGTSDPRRGEGPNRADPQPLPGAVLSSEGARRALDAALAQPLPSITWTGSCTTLKCINTRLNALKNAVNKVEANLNSLRNCLAVQGVSAWGEDPYGGTYGYVWRDDYYAEEFLTTGLDYDDLEYADIWAVVWTC